VGSDAGDDKSGVSDDEIGVGDIKIEDSVFFKTVLLCSLLIVWKDTMQGEKTGEKTDSTVDSQENYLTPSYADPTAEQVH
jgi:hypothetical protein